MKSYHATPPGGRHAFINLLLILFVILPFTVGGVWGAIKLHTTIFPVDPDAMMPPFPQGVAFLIFLALGLLVGGLLGGFVWAAIAKQFMSRDEVYRQASFGVRIPGITEINKAYLRWIYRNEGKKR